MPEDVTVIEMRLYLCKTRSDPKYLFWIPYTIGWESSSLYTCNTILCSVHYMIHYSAISKTITAHYQSTVSMISFAQVWTAQWSDTIPCQNVWFTVRIHLTLFRFNKYFNSCQYSTLKAKDDTADGPGRYQVERSKEDQKEEWSNGPRWWWCIYEIEF